MADRKEIAEIQTENISPQDAVDIPLIIGQPPQVKPSPSTNTHVSKHFACTVLQSCCRISTGHMVSTTHTERVVA